MFKIKENGEKYATSEFVSLHCERSVTKQDDMDDREGTLRAISTDHRRMPYMKPLYWKWMWSTMMKPGCMNKDAEMIF